MCFNHMRFGIPCFQMTANDLLNKSTFTCTCVRELWKLLQLCTDCLSEKNCCQVSNDPILLNSRKIFLYFVEIDTYTQEVE